MINGVIVRIDKCPVWSLDMKIGIKSDTIKENYDVLKEGFSEDLLAVPIVLSVIHELITDAANKNNQTFDSLLEDIKETEAAFPSMDEKRYIKYEIKYDNM